MARISRIYVDEALQPGSEYALGQATAHYLARVLRLGAGDELVLFNGDGCDYSARLERVTGSAVAVSVLKRVENTAESPLRITLGQALSRGERMDYCLQKATELGVHAVQLLRSERVEVKLSGSRLEKRMAHWQGVMQSASEQSGRAVVPELHAPVELTQWCASDHARLLLDGRADTPLTNAVVSGPVSIAVGPEGGFSEREIAMAVAAGCRAVRLGPRVLRTETAGPAAIAVLQSMAGDF